MCPTGFYANGTAEFADCVTCSVCAAGEGTAEPCGDRSDTVCRACAEGRHSKPTSTGRECAECRRCAPERTEISPCSATRNSVCGSCSSGYFLYVDEEGSECLRCSECPADREVFRWQDCDVAGEPTDSQCAPGEWMEEYTTSTKRTIVKPTETVAQAEKPTRLPTNHGLFVPMKNYDMLGDRVSLDSAITAKRNIAVVSISFTAATTTAFCIAIGCLFREQLCPCCCRRKRKSWTIKHTFQKPRKTRHPVQVSEDSGSSVSRYHMTAIT